jgi:hypothetical protein
MTADSVIDSATGSATRKATLGDEDTAHEEQEKPQVQQQGEEQVAKE